MTRKDYEAVARAIAETHGTHPNHYAAIADLTVKLANVFAADSGRFDRERFYRAAWCNDICRYCGEPNNTHTPAENNYCQERMADFKARTDNLH
jgi:HD superfamily phosphohydrolase YqeK